MMKNLIKYPAIAFGTSVVVERLISFAILPILTKSLPPEVYAIWTQIVITGSFLTTLLLLGLDSALIKFYASKPNLKTAFHKLSLVIIINILTITLITFPFHAQIGGLIFGAGVDIINVKLLLIVAITQALFDFSIAYLRTQGRIARLSIYNLIRYSSRAIVLGVFVYLMGAGLTISIIIMSLIQLFLILILYFTNIYKGPKEKTNDNGIKLSEILSFSTPLIPYTLLIWVYNFINRYFLLYYEGIESLSIYAANYSLAATLTLFYSVILYVSYSEMASKWNLGNKKEALTLLEDRLMFYLFIITPLLIALPMVRSQIIYAISTPFYNTEWTVFASLMVAIGFIGVQQLGQLPLLLEGKTKTLMGITLGVAIVSIGLNFVLVPSFGILGAAMAFGLSCCLSALTTIYISQKWNPIKLKVKPLIRIALLTTISIIFLYYIKSIFELDSIYKTLIALTVSASIYIGLDLYFRNSILREWKNIFIKQF
ncbi:MAG: oligosaccharide flippase family protein [Sphingomonadales bacterium]